MGFWSSFRVFFLGPTSAATADVPGPTGSPPPASQESPADELAFRLMKAAADANDRDAAASTSVAVAKEGSTPVTVAPGVPGFDFFGGYPNEKEKSPDLQGAAKWRTFTEFKKNVAIVGAGLGRFLEFVGSPTWSVPPFDDTEESAQRARFAEQQIRNLGTPWRTVVQTLAMGRFDGSSISVWTARKMPDGGEFGGWIGLEDIEPRPMHTIDRYLLDDKKRVIGVVQRDPSTGEEHVLERGRMVWLRDAAMTDAPPGVGKLRLIAEAVRELTALRKMSGKGFEKDLGGTLAVYAPIENMRARIGKPVEGSNPPRNYTELDFKRAIEGVEKFVANPLNTDAPGFLLDSGVHKNKDGTLSAAPLYRAELMAAGAQSHAPLLERIRLVLWEIAIVLGFEYLLLGNDGSGSLAMAEAKTADSYRLIVGTLNQIAEIVQRDVLRPLWALNGWGPETAPLPSFDRLEFVDVLKVVRDLLGGLAAGGITLDRRDLVLVNALLKRLGLPPLEDNEEDMVVRDRTADQFGIGRPPQPPAPGGAGGGGESSTPGVTVDQQDKKQAGDAKPAVQKRKAA